MTLDQGLNQIAEAQHRISDALDTIAKLGEAYASALIAADGLECGAVKLRGAYDMAVESRDLWKERAIAGWQPDLAAEAVRADIEASRGEPWAPTSSNGAPVALAEAVGLALGSASMAWHDVEAAGVFDEAWCTKVYDGLMAYLADWADEHRRLANEATAAKLAVQHQSSRGSDVEAWIKRYRETCCDAEGHRYGSWYVVDNLLDDYREHADTGTPLADEVEGPHPEV